MLTAGESQHGNVRLGRQADALDRLRDDSPVVRAKRAGRPARGYASCLHDLAHRGRRVDAELRSLREVAEARAAAEAVSALAEEVRVTARRPLDPEGEAQERRLATAVRAGDGDELAGRDREVDVAQHERPASVAEPDTAEIDR